jgi:chromosomal replication initiator protein
MDAIWTRCMELFRGKVSPHSVATWLEPVRLEAITDGSAILSVPNSFFMSWLRDNYLNLLADTLTQVTGIKYEIVFTSRNEVTDPSKTDREEIRLGEMVCQDLSLTDEFTIQHNLNPRYSFESFVVGSCNEFARAAALSVVEKLGEAYNPLFIYGGVGLGKTHLMSAIGYGTLTRDKKRKVSFSTSEEFTNEMINALRYDKMQEFRNKYRNVDLFLIDDIQFLARKERTQEEFLHTFNRLYEARKQIVITADCFPNDLADIEQRLKSRFCWGLVADIGAPDLETRVAILKRKAFEDSINLPDDVAIFLAEEVESNVRDLVGNLIRVVAMSTLQGKPLSKELVETSLKSLMRRQSKPITIEHIITQVAKAFNVKPLEIKSRKKHKLYSFPRQVGMYLARELTECSYPEIGVAFGGKDHSTVIYAARKIEKGMENDESLKSMIEGLKKEIRK